MRPGPPKFLESFFAVLIPPSCREEVLGDLCEKYASPLQYTILAIRTIPCVILSRARRVTEGPVLFMQALLIYGCYLAAAFYRDRAFLYGPYGLLRTALPLLPFLLILVLRDVYYPYPKSVLRMIGSVSFAAVVTFLAMVRMACGHDSVCLARTLPDWMNLLGAASSLLLVSAVRILFRSHPNMQQAAGPAHWLKQTPAPIALPRNALSIVAIAAAITACAILMVSGGAKPGVVGGLIAVLVIFGARFSGSRKE